MDLSFFSEFLNKETIHQLTFGQKMTGSAFVTMLGMGITFVGLIFIMFIMEVSSRVIRGYELRMMGKPAEVISRSEHVISAQPVAVTPAVLGEDDIDPETVAAIMAALSVAMQTSVSNIVISNVKRVSPEWNKAGRAEQFASRF